MGEPMTLDHMREDYEILCQTIKELKTKLFRLNLDKMILANRMTRVLFNKPEVNSQRDLLSWVTHTQQAAQARTALPTPIQHQTPTG